MAEFTVLAEMEWDSYVQMVRSEILLSTMLALVPLQDLIVHRCQVSVVVNQAKVDLSAAMVHSTVSALILNLLELVNSLLVM
jgi:hypothetical protein